MASSDDSSPRSFVSCSRCGSSTSHPFASEGGVCLRCAGERAFALGSGAPFSAGAPALDSLANPRIGSYEIIEELGCGGMARVYAARQGGLGRIVALKVLPTGGGADGELELRFLREAQTVARLRHRHIVAIHDSGRTASHVYFSMDYVEGGDLARRLRERAFAPREAAVLLHKVADALAHAHAEGILHRDLKPSNILLDGDEPRLADFGLAAQLETGGDLTLRTRVLGTPHYLAPEALAGGSAALSVASDVYALGVVMFELLTGRTPFAGASPAELAVLLKEKEPVSPRLLAPATPRDLDTICLKCLERDPARRYPGAAALAEDLRRFLAGEPIRARPISAGGHFVRWCRRRPALAGLWVLAFALAVGSSLAAVWIARERARTEDALIVARQSEASAREHLREARLAEARAVRRTTTPGRRAQALAALAEAARIRPGADLRDEAAAALLLSDIHPEERWDLSLDVPAELTFSPRGNVVAVDIRGVDGLQHSPAKLRRWGEPASFATLEVPGTSAVGPLRFNTDGSRVIARYLDATLRVWRTADAQLEATVSERPLPGPESLTEAYNDDYDFSPDGATFVLGLPAGGFSVHRTPDATELARWTEGPRFSTLRFSPDGRHLAAVDITQRTPQTRAFLLSMPDCRLEHVLELGAQPNSIAWSSDSRMLAIALDDNTVSTFDARDGHLVQHVPLATRDLWWITFAGADDSLIAGRGHASALHFTSAALGREELVLDGGGPGALQVVGGRSAIIVPSLQNVATRWAIDPPTGFRIIPVPRPIAYMFGADNCGLDFSPDGRWVASGHGRYTLMREVATGRLGAELDRGETTPGDYVGVAFDTTTTAIFRGSVGEGFQRCPFTIAADGAVLFGPTETLDPEPGFVMADRTPDRRRFLFLDHLGGRVKIVEVDGERTRLLARWSTPNVYSAVFSPDGERVILNFTGMGADAAAQKIRIHCVSDGAPLGELPAPVSCDVTWSADGRIVMTSNGQSDSIIWDAQTWTRRVSLSGELGGNITTFTLSPDGEVAAIAHDEKLHLVSTRDGSPLITLELPGASGLAATVKFLPDRRRLAVLWRDGRIDLIDPAAIRNALEPLGLAW